MKASKQRNPAVILALAISGAAAVFGVNAQAAEVACQVAYRTVGFEYTGDLQDAQQVAGKLQSTAASMSSVAPQKVLDKAFGTGNYTLLAQDHVVFRPDGGQIPHGDLDEGRKAGKLGQKPSLVQFRDGWRFLYRSKVEQGINTEIVAQHFAETPKGSKPDGVTATGLLKKGGYLVGQWGPAGREGFVSQLVGTNCL